VKVNHIEKGINPSSVHKIYFTGDYLGKGFKIGVTAGMIALTVSKTNTSTSFDE
jgi:high affinity sulfate transporter 1